MKLVSILLIPCASMTLCLQRSPLPPHEKKLVWSDEFNYTGAPDSTKWQCEHGYLRNNEMQYYTDRPENVRVENGSLVIEARNDSAMINKKRVPVTSASINTKNKATWTYGHFEVRAKIPSALGTWPAIWLLGDNIDKIDWPDCGEIDVMENVGFDPDMIHNTIHTKAYNHVIHTQKGHAVAVPHPADDFHIYALDWTADKIDFLIDGKTTFSFPNEKKGNDQWPFDKPFYLILNFAFGGAWGGQKGVNLKAMPLKYYIDYVRVYQ